jgi:hypothetical protein
MRNGYISINQIIYLPLRLFSVSLVFMVWDVDIRFRIFVFSLFSIPLTLAIVNNFTVHLEKEIQNTNSMVNKVLSDGNARKQDFIALMNVTNVLKTRFSKIPNICVQSVLYSIDFGN